MLSNVPIYICTYFHYIKAFIVLCNITLIFTERIIDTIKIFFLHWKNNTKFFHDIFFSYAINQNVVYLYLSRMVNRINSKL